jgi:hypothetical protein
MTKLERLQLIVLMLIFSLFQCCSTHNKIYLSETKSTKIEIIKESNGMYQFLFIDKYYNKEKELRFILMCEDSRGGYGISKEYKGFSWKAVTDTIQKCVFFDKSINEESIVRPTVFMPITEEEINLLKTGINEAGKDFARLRWCLLLALDFYDKTKRISSFFKPLF